MLKGLYEKGRKMDWKVPEPDGPGSPKREPLSPPLLAQGYASALCPH